MLVPLALRRTSVGVPGDAISDLLAALHINVCRISPAAHEAHLGY